MTYFQVFSIPVYFPLLKLSFFNKYYLLSKGLTHNSKRKNHCGEPKDYYLIMCNKIIILVQTKICFSFGKLMVSTVNIYIHV